MLLFMYAVPKGQLTCPATLLCIAGKKERTELMEKAEGAIVSEMMTSKWRESHPEAVYFQGPPLIKEYEGFTEVPEPEPVPFRDWNQFELRAFVEKRHSKAGEDAVWSQRKQDIGRCASCHDDTW